MNIRKFRLINGNGQEYHLTVRAHFFHSPGGLGYAKDVTYQRVGHLFKRINEFYTQGGVSGEVFFPDPHAYEKYQEMISFAEAGELFLVYQPARQMAEYRCLVNLTEVEKTEKQAGGLNIGVKFTAETMWYRILSEFNDGSEVTEGKVYDYTYDYTYADYVSNTVSFESDTKVASPMRIYVYGPMVNPTWSYYHNNVLKGTGRVNGEIPKGNLLLIDTTAIPYQIKQLDGFLNVVQDMYALSDFGTERFFMALPGNNRISVAHEGTTPLKVRTEVQLLYASV